MKKLIIFGAGDIAELAHFYFTHDSDREVVGFTVDAEFLESDSLQGKPLVPFEEVRARFDPGEHDLFVALSYSGINELRKEKYLAAKDLGYAIASYVSTHATVFPGFEPGENCFILEDNTIQPFARVGNNVTLWSGNHIGHHSRIEDHCFIASHVVVSGGVVIEDSCFIGVNATIRDHVTIGRKSVIGASAVILSDVEAEGVYSSSGTERARIPSSRLRRI